METKYPYVTKLDIKYPHLEKIDVPQMVRECTDKWFNQTLTKVNDSVIRLGIFKGNIIGISMITMTNSSLSWKDNF